MIWFKQQKCVTNGGFSIEKLEVLVILIAKASKNWSLKLTKLEIDHENHDVNLAN